MYSRTTDLKKVEEFFGQMKNDQDGRIARPQHSGTRIIPPQLPYPQRPSGAWSHPCAV